MAVRVFSQAWVAAAAQKECSGGPEQICIFWVGGSVEGGRKGAEIFPRKIHCLGRKRKRSVEEWEKKRGEIMQISLIIALGRRAGAAASGLPPSLPSAPASPPVLSCPDPPRKARYDNLRTHFRFHAKTVHV